MFMPQKVAWQQAEDHCVSIGAHLLAIESPAEQAAITPFVEGKPQYSFIGATDIVTEADWIWSNGEPLGFLNWGPQEPNNAGEGEHCAVINSDNDKWDDLPCTSEFSFVCER